MFYLTKKLPSNCAPGFTLVEVLIASGLLCGLALFLAQMLVDHQKGVLAQRTVSSRDNLKNALERYIAHPKAIKESSEYDGVTGFPKNLGTNFDYCVNGTTKKTPLPACHPGCCNANIVSGITLTDPLKKVIAGPNPTPNPAVFNEHGAICPGNNPTPQCPLISYATFSADCGGPATCEQARFVTISYRLEQGPSIQLRAGPPLRAEQGDATSSIPLEVTKFTGVVNYLAKWTSTTNLSVSEVYEEPTNHNLQIGKSTTFPGPLPPAKLSVIDDAPVSNYYKWLDGKDQSVIAAFRGGKLEDKDNVERARVVIEGNKSTTVPTLEFRIDDPSGENRGAHLYYANKDTLGIPGGNPEIFSIWTHTGSSIFNIDVQKSNVGIGTLTPEARLHIKTDSDPSEVQLIVESSSPETGLRLKNTATADTWQVGVEGSPADIPIGSFFIQNESTSITPFVINPVGDVGIGTTAPAARLDIRGTTGTTGLSVTGAANNSKHLLFINDQLGDPNIDRVTSLIAFGKMKDTGYNTGLLLGGEIGPTNLSASHLALSNSGPLGNPIRLVFADGPTGTTPGTITSAMVGPTIANGGWLSFSTHTGGGIVEAIKIDPNQNVGIGPGVGLTHRLNVNGNSKFTGNGSFTGDVDANSFITPSDLRLKENVQDVTGSIEKLASLRTMTYEWKRKEFPGRKFPPGKYMGVVAQEVEKVFPEVVKKDSNGFFSVDYSRLVVPIIDAIRKIYELVKSWNNEIHELKKEIDFLKEERNSFKSQLSEMKTLLCNDNPAAGICQQKPTNSTLENL